MRTVRHILLVGENDAVMAPLRFVLRNLSYKVTSLNDGQEAINLICKRGEDFDLLLVQLPVTPIEEFLTVIRDVEPSLSVLTLNVINKPAMAEILDRVKVMTARRRGPKIGSHHREKAA